MTLNRGFGRFDTVAIAGGAIFGALSIVLTYISQLAGLNFPFLPYLQFDLGEIAIFLTLFIFGPVPAFISAFVESVALLAVGENVPIGPPLKLAATISSILGIWAGTVIASRLRKPKMSGAVGLGTGVGIVGRIIGTTIANYILIEFVSKYFSEYSLAEIVPYEASHFTWTGIHLTMADGLVVILGFTAIFNAIQIFVVLLVAYSIVGLHQVRSMRIAGRRPWIFTMIERQGPPAATLSQPASPPAAGPSAPESR